MYDLPLIAPTPPRLSEMRQALRQIEARRIYSNGGPVLRRFEADCTARLFGGQGATLAVNNATIGLMIALRRAVGLRIGERRLALMPALTFAATAQAALWAGLTPLVCDIEPDSWVPSAAAEEELLARHAGRIAAIVPYATFGRPIDLDRYAWLAARHDVAVVVDAAASLGSIGPDGRNFGAGARFAVVYSMHATKTFSTGEGGLIHSADTDLIDDLRKMVNFGFGTERRAESLGLNAKLTEVGALLASAKLAEIDAVCAHRDALARTYAERLEGFAIQAPSAHRQAYQFWSVLLPEEVAPQRAAIIHRLASEGIGAAHYFSPHLGEQALFREEGIVEPTPVADAVSARILSLPITDRMRVADVATICDRLLAAIEHSALETLRERIPAPPLAPCETVLIGGGPAGTAMLTAASKAGRLPALAAGLTIVEAGDALGRGELGKFAIRSDSTAETFLTAVKDNPHAEIARLGSHAAARGIARHIGALGAPLVEAGPLLAVTGDALGRIVGDHGGRILTGHSAITARRLSGDRWATQLKMRGGTMREVVSQNLVLATGGYQCPDRLRATRVAGAALGEIASERLIGSDDFLRVGGIEALRERLDGRPDPRIAIVGGSTSALAAANLLLKAAPGLPLGAGGVTVMHRRPLRPFYPSAEAARTDGFTDFTADDICPVSGFVYRLAGFRLEARELVLRMLEVGGRRPEPRLALHRLAGEADAGARAILARADVVIAATGYRPRALTLFDRAGDEIVLACRSAAGGPLVDRRCRVLDAAGQPVRGVYGIGLAAGFVPSGRLGGEPSFRGAANGLWLWQNDVGALIVEQLLAEAAGEDIAPAVAAA
jgi:dTDP-4-amino-4,6-dideoxygalactose transaminase